MASESRAPRSLYANVLALTAVLWTAHWGILVTRSAAVGSVGGIEGIVIRLVVSFLGAISTLALHGLLRHGHFRALNGLVLTIALSVPLSILLALINENVWLYGTDWYQTHEHFTAADVHAGHCFTVGSACHSFLTVTVYTASTLIWVYVAWCALYSGLLFAEDLRERDRRLVVAEGTAHQAQLSALRLQLNPHFLFNTLNMLSGLVATGRKALAEDVILNLSQFLRYSLSGESDQLVTLADELEGQRMYLDIERVRFADRLHVLYDVPEECLVASVPSFLLQPLVENSIKYAVLPSESEVHLKISASRREDMLVLTVANTAPRPTVVTPTSGFGIGISNIGKRLGALFPGRASIETGQTTDGGWMNVIKLPWVVRPS